MSCLLAYICWSGVPVCIQNAGFNESHPTSQITFMTLLYHLKFAGDTRLLSPNRVTFYSNLTDVRVMMPSPSKASPSPYPERRRRYLRGSDGDDFNPPQPSNDV